jgi:UDP-glucose 4-epimerase
MVRDSVCVHQAQSQILLRIKRNIIRKNAVYNFGNGLGYSVKEMIEMCENVTGRKAVIEYTDRCLSAPERLVASSQKIYEEFWGGKRNIRLKALSQAHGNGIAEM